MTEESPKVVLVTGGARGLGLGICRDLLASGYRVGTCSRQMSPDIEELLAVRGGESLFWQPCQIGDEAEEKKFFSQFLEWSGKRSFYGLVNNAGVAKEGILATFPNIETERIIDVNLLGAIRLTRLALQVLLGRPGPGRVVNISSIIAVRGYTGLSAYSASKAGLDGFTRAVAREVGRRQITVNAVNPGYLDTDMSASLGSDQRQQIVRRTPLGRLGTVDDVVPVVNFLLSPQAAFVTGQSIVVDGGISS